MGVIKSTTGGDSQEQKNSETNPEMIKALLDTVNKLKDELSDLKKQGQPQAAAVSTVAGGLSSEQFSELLKEVAKSVKEKPDSEKYDVKRFIDEKDVPKDDWLPEGVTFCAYSAGYVIVDDVRNGFPVSTPYGRTIFFEYQASKRYRGVKGEEMSTYCAYTSHSKKEVEWLRNHRYFGIIFFESAKEALSVNAYKSNKLIAMINMINNMPQDRVVARCKEHGIGIHDDLRLMKISLAHKMAEIDLQSEAAAQGKRLSESIENDVFSK